MLAALVEAVCGVLTALIALTDPELVVLSGPGRESTPAGCRLAAGPVCGSREFLIGLVVASTLGTVGRPEMNGAAQGLRDGPG